MSPQLDSSGGIVRVGGLGVSSPGLVGSVESSGRRVGIRSLAERRGSLRQDLQTALDRLLFEEQESADISVTGRTTPATGVRGLAAPPGRLTVEAPPPREGFGQVVLSTDGRGLVQWHFAERPRRVTGLRAAADLPRQYVIGIPDLTIPGRHALVGAIVRKIVKVITFPIDDAVGRVSDFFAGRWEEKYRPYRLRTFLPSNYRKAEAPTVTAERIRRMKGQRVLLIVHGTFSQSHTGLGRLRLDTMKALRDAYEGRILAFDHFTISHTPEENVEKLISLLPEDTDLELDILCHSRGGLVSRVLAEQVAPSLSSRTIKVRKIVFVATPNQGTVLADGDHLNDMVDRYTSMITLFPSAGMLDAIEAILTVVKQLAVSAFKGLDGIRVMEPGGDFLNKLNTGTRTPTKYYAFAANYEPTQRRLSALAKDFLADHIFGEDNDLIVPTAGVYEGNGDGSFPITRKYVFGEHSGVQHSTFFATHEFDQKLRQWLS